VAKELVARGSIEGDEVDLLVELADGKVDTQAISKYRELKA
jgi:hypothetical protein